MTVGDPSAETVKDANAHGDRARTSSTVPVAFVSSHAAQGGAKRYLALLVENLSDEWVSSFTCLKEGPLVDELRAKGHPVEVVDTGRHAMDVFRAARRLRASFEVSRPAVVHANGIKAALVAELATARTSTPVIWFKHDVAMDGWRGRLVARRAALIVGVSAAVLESLGGVAPGRREVLHPQIPEPRVDAAAARALVLREFVPDVPGAVVVLVGRLDPYKGQSELIAVAQDILARAPDTRFLLVGNEDPTHPGRRRSSKKRSPSAASGDRSGSPAFAPTPSTSSAGPTCSSCRASPRAGTAARGSDMWGSKRSPSRRRSSFTPRVVSRSR